MFAGTAVFATAPASAACAYYSGTPEKPGSVYYSSCHRNGKSHRAVVDCFKSDHVSVLTYVRTAYGRWQDGPTISAADCRGLEPLNGRTEYGHG
jgi:hypothetical protein